ncbi:c-type cytochrome [Desulfobaculum bizertense]|uniref:Cytochrome c n=1 Tax=Desulfobaculum bizertense DSM 18034 TaxID=1121442 RepID=A0A1T4VFN0_9BACT|nr:c-type cytochrome [Desulfobaculum bizertense]UIJ37743.1 c-type cytochrome [Desulfobaculum bizertense]SKA63769.1 cytochrome c [Desulfobaculum bizertense DSM 18034]
MRKAVVTGIVCALFTFGAVGIAQADAHKLYKSKCAGCHGQNGEKLALGAGVPLKGHSAADLEKMMKGYLDGTYGGNKKTIMVNILKKLSPEEISGLAKHIEGFK